MLSAEKFIGALVLAHSGYEWRTVLKPYKIVEKVVLNATCKDNLFNVIREVSLCRHQVWLAITNGR